MKHTNVLFLVAVLVAQHVDVSSGFVVRNQSPFGSCMTVATGKCSKTSSTSTSTSLNSFGDLKGIVDFFKPKEVEAEPIIQQFEDVTIEPDFRIAGLFLSLGALLDLIPYIQLTLGPLVTLLGVLFLVQTFRLRFVFDATSLELATIKNGELQTSGENIVVGGANRWSTESIINYEFFPKGWVDNSPTGPILVYFKETQTPSDKWNEGPGKSANDPEKIASGEVKPGQVHFFPAICNTKQIRDEFEKRGCRKL